MELQTSVQDMQSSRENNIRLDKKEWIIATCDYIVGY